MARVSKRNTSVDNNDRNTNTEQDVQEQYNNPEPSRKKLFSKENNGKFLFVFGVGNLIYFAGSLLF